MKIKIDKSLENGQYNVVFSALNFTEKELDNMKRFGSPVISIEPNNYFNGHIRVRGLPIHALGRVFQFSSEKEATEFVAIMTERIKEAATLLQKQQDGFSGVKELDL